LCIAPLSRILEHSSSPVVRLPALVPPYGPPKQRSHHSAHLTSSHLILNWTELNWIGSADMFT